MELASLPDRSMSPHVNVRELSHKLRYAVQFAHVSDNLHLFSILKTFLFIRKLSKIFCFLDI